MVEQLDPIIIDKSDNCSPIAKADAVRIKFDETDVENYILFANANSTNLHLRNAYTFYTENKLLLDELVSNLPKDVFHEDDLGGGIYVPFGIGSICQNSKPGKYQRWNKHQVPYTRNETHYMQNYKVFELYGKIMGEIACAIFDVFPSIYKQNQERYHDAEDCCYPTPGMQFSAKNKDKFWFAHQAIIRVIGKPFGEMFGEMLKIALHADESDAPGIQMLSFLSMGGEDGCGGHVEGTDLLVFRDRTGGPCYRLNTTVRDTVVVILFNGKNQLHGGAVDRNCTRELRMENNLFRYYTTRIVHYLRGPAEEFTKARATYSGSDAPVVFVRSSPPSNKKHIQICKETIQYNQLVILPWGKEKKMEKAKLRIENDTMHCIRPKMYIKRNLRMLVVSSLSKERKKYDRNEN